MQVGDEACRATLWNGACQIHAGSRLGTIASIRYRADAIIIARGIAAQLRGAAGAIVHDTMIYIIKHLTAIRLFDRCLWRSPCIGEISGAVAHSGVMEHLVVGSARAAGHQNRDSN